MARTVKPPLDIKDVPAKIVGKHIEVAQDIISEYDLKWKYIGINGKDFPIADEGQVPNRILLVIEHPIVKDARIG